MKHVRGILLLTTILAAVPASAQTSNPLASRESKIPPIVSWLQSQGVKLTYLGDTGGLAGYLAESANGKMQTFYVAPDGKHTVAGILFEQGGKNVTGIQIGEMRARFDAAASGLESATVDGSPASAAAQDTPVHVDPSVQEQEQPQKPFGETVPQQEDTPSDLPAPVSAPALATADEASAAVQLPPAEGPVAGASGNPSELWISKIDKDEFLKEASNTPYFEVGSTSAPATLWMVADPRCPYCHKTWDHISQAVFGRKLKVRVILIAGLPGSEPIARDILARPIPARAWLDSDAGRNLKPEVDPASSEFTKAGTFLEMNMDFARKFKIDRTPFLGYFGKDGQFYSALGLPSDLDSFLAEAGIK